MKDNKGFTLVELLAVIAILAILVVIALPNVLDMFNSAKQNSFATEVQTIMKTAQQQYVLDSGSKSKYGSSCTDKIKLSGETMTYYVEFNSGTGGITKLKVSSSTFWYDSTKSTKANPININDIKYKNPASDWGEGSSPVTGC